jgi:hypothetical protein
MRNISRKFIALIAGFVAFSIPAVAQNPAVFGGAANAYAFAYGANPLVAPLQIDTTNATTGAGVATFTVAFGTTKLGDGTIITPLSTSAPITVGTAGNAETVTPSAVSCGTPTVYQSCSFTATFANAHGTGDKIASASYGLQEAATFVAGRGSGLVLLDATWFKRQGINPATKSAVDTAVEAFKSVSAAVTVLDWSGVTGGTGGAAGTNAAVSYTAASGSNYAVPGTRGTAPHILY